MFQHGEIHRCNCEAEISSLIIKKKQPRRIVLEETEEDNQTGCGKLMDQILYCHDDILIRMSKAKKYWREVKENDLSLTNDELKLSLTVDECKEIMNLHDHESVKKKLINKIRKFLEDK